MRTCQNPTYVQSGMCQPGISYFNPHHTRGVPYVVDVICCMHKNAITDDMLTLLQLLSLRLDLDHGDYHAETSTKDGRPY